MTCPQCGHVFNDSQQRAAGRARWAGVGAEQRNQQMRALALVRWQKPKPKRTKREAFKNLLKAIETKRVKENYNGRRTKRNTHTA